MPPRSHRNWIWSWTARRFGPLIATATGGRRREEPAASAARGKELVHQPLNPPFWSMRAYREAWKQWGGGPRPDDYARAFRDRYGLHEPPYDNGGLPMGFTRSAGLLGLGTGLGSDCLLCHAGRVAGQTIVGLGNTALDMQSLYEELAAADGLDPVMPLPLCNVRGTSEASNFAIYLMQFRDKELAPACRSSTRSARTSAKTSRPGGTSGGSGRSTTWESPTAARCGR